MKKLLAWRPSVKIMAAVFTGILVLTLIPLLRLALYSVPWYDDYLYGRYVKAAVGDGGGFFQILRSAWEPARIEWWAFQGTFSSIFLMALVPCAWGQQYYFIGPVILILLPVAGVFALVGVLSRDVCGFDRAQTLCLQSGVSAIVLMFIYTAQQGFYWFNGGLHYVGMHSFLMMFIALAVKLLKAKNRAALVFLVPGTMLGALAAGGSNYVTALQGGLLILSVAGFGFLCKNKRFLLLLPSVLVYGFCFYKNVTAPGNSKRMALFADWGCGPVEAVLRSFWEGILHLWEFTGLITLAALAVLVPVIWQMVKKSDYKFRYPGLVLAWSVCLYASGFTPSLYSLGHAGLSRALNAVKITYQLLLIINVVYWIGYYCRRAEKQGRETWNGTCPWWFYPAVGAEMLLIFAAASNQAGNYSAYGAYYYVHTGEAYNFYHEYLDRVELLESGEKDVLVKPYGYQPWFLCMGDWSEDPDHEINRAIAVWFDVDSVAVSPAK